MEKHEDNQYSRYTQARFRIQRMITILSEKWYWRLAMRIPFLNSFLVKRVFREGKDGNLRIGGNTPSHIPGMLQMHRGDGYLQRDVELKNLSVKRGFKLNTNGYSIYVKDVLHLHGAVRNHK